MIMRTTFLTLALIFSLRLFSQTSVCGTSVELMADTIGSNAVSGYWTCSYNGVVITNIDNSSLHYRIIADATGITNFFINSMQTVWFFWHYIDNQSTSHIDSMRVIFYEVPNCVNHSDDTIYCGSIIQLNGNFSINNSIGQWSSIPSTNIFFIPNNDPNATINVTHSGDYQIIWTEMNAGNTACRCSDTFNLTFLPTPYSETPEEITICNSNWAYICGNSNMPAQWSGPTGVTFHDSLNGPVNPMGSYNSCTWIKYPSINDTIYMFYTASNGYCYSYDSVKISFLKAYPPVIITNPIDSISNSNQYISLCATAPTYGYGYWVDNQLNTHFQPSNQTSCGVTASVQYSGIHCFKWITVNHSCRDTSDAFCVNFVGINENYMLSNLNLYPNPFREDVFITSSISVNAKIEWYSIDGKKMFENITRIEVGENIIEKPQNLDVGIYFIIIKTDNDNKTYRVSYLK